MRGMCPCGCAARSKTRSRILERFDRFQKYVECSRSNLKPLEKMLDASYVKLCLVLIAFSYLIPHGVCMKEPRKYVQNDLAAMSTTTGTESSFKINDTMADTYPISGSVVPLNQNKMSHTKLKLQNENLSGKKLTARLSSVNDNIQIETEEHKEDVTSISTATMQRILKQENEQRDVPRTNNENIVKKNLTSTLNSTVNDKIGDSIGFDSSEPSEAEMNSTLKEHNITKSLEDNHLYYKSSWSNDRKISDAFWQRHAANLTVNKLLSNSHRRATTMLLSFDFPYYGFPIRNITIASGGFLYTGDYVHSWLASTQYIAPLMANFDTALSDKSFVKYSDDGQSFTVVWENVFLQDRPNNGSFTFSVMLNKSGDIVFAYKKIPIDIQQIIDNPSTKHPVKIGLSDAYIIDKTIIRTKQKTIYEYHRVNFGQSEVRNGTIITLTALPTCFSFNDCRSCIMHIGADFKCLWCPTINRCSTGTDRKRQDWVQKGCDKTVITDETQCPAIGQKGNNFGEPIEVLPESSRNISTERTIEKINSVTKVHAYHSEPHHISSNSNLLVSVLILIVICFICIAWIIYAYRNPHTKSGQLLIRYRPNKWSWRRGEARYTAATIHM
ncbi:plexin domain-containing protein 1-like isoform X2 [Anopheles albimanus]|uniref:plexin domain-containing protein 1-like isoform X2 n=1 Tax=Anopheles albimanus TaxID=7167 RepID=UPI00163F1962|nr:plexin domain-containing protein 1-like isoform X2 [Anopheles albimanus]